MCCQYKSLLSLIVADCKRLVHVGGQPEGTTGKLSRTICQSASEMYMSSIHRGFLMALRMQFGLWTMRFLPANIINSRKLSETLGHYLKPSANTNVWANYLSYTVYKHRLSVHVACIHIFRIECSTTSAWTVFKLSATIGKLSAIS